MLNTRGIVILLQIACAPLVSAQTPGDQVWLFPTGAPVVSSPSLDDAGNIIFGSEDTLVYSINPALTLNWVARAGDMVTGNVAVSPMGYTVATSWDGHIYALTSNGSILWSYNTHAFISGSPAISVTGTIYVGARDGILYALGPDGGVKWFHIANSSIQGSPSIGPDGTVYFGDESGTFYALNPDGLLKWKFVADLIANRTSRIRTTPAIDRSGTVYFGSGNHYFYALNPDGTLKWTIETSDKNDSSAAIDTHGNIIFGSRDRYLYKVDGSTGAQLWKVLIGDVFYCSPAVDAQDTIYIAAYIGSGITRLYAINPDSTVLWDRNYSGLNDSSPVLSKDGFLYIGFNSGILYKIYAGRGPADSPWPMLARNAAHTSGLDGVFDSAERVGNWIVSPWFGWLNAQADPLYYHPQHAWIIPESADADDFWFYDLSTARWFWTSRSSYPLLHMEGHGWVWYALETVAPNRWFFLYSSKQWLEQKALPQVF